MQGELIGNHYWVGSGGALRQLGRLPDFIGGPVFAGAWIENGDAFDDWSLAKWRTNLSAGILMDTLLGPMVLAGRPVSTAAGAPMSASGGSSADEPVRADRRRDKMPAMVPCASVLPRSRQVLMVAMLAVALPAAAQVTPQRPFGTVREQAALQQAWLKQRLDTVLPALMRKHGIDLWVVPMREYNEDPVFTALVAPETFAARRRTIYVFFDTCAATGQPPAPTCLQRIALGGTSQGGLYEARRATAAAASNVGRGQQAELWGDDQWQVLKSVIEERSPRVIGINRSTVFAFSDGLSSGELQGMTAALGPAWAARFKDAEGLPLELIAARLARRRGVLHEDADAGVGDDRGDVLGQDDHPRGDPHERPGVVVAPARQRPGAGHVVPAERRRAAPRRRRR